MTTSKYVELTRLLADTGAEAAALYRTAAAVADEFDRVALPDDAAQLVYDGLTRAGTAGSADAWLLLARVLARHAGPAASIEAFRLADRVGSPDGAIGWITAATTPVASTMRRRPESGCACCTEPGPTIRGRRCWPGTSRSWATAARPIRGWPCGISWQRPNAETPTPLSN